MKETKFKRIQCVDRAIDILDAVGRGGCRTINDIAGRVRLNPATVYNIVKTLAVRGFINEASGDYAIGSKLGLMASRWDVTKELPLLAAPIIEEINRMTGEAVCVTIMAGMRAEIVNLMPGSRQVSVQFLHRAWKYPLNLGTGRLLVALGDKDDWERFIEKHIEGGPKNLSEKKWDGKTWRMQLDKIRSQGHVIVRIVPEGEDEEIGAVACPLRAPNGALVAAIGCSCPISRATDAHLAFIKETIYAAIAENPL